MRSLVRRSYASAFHTPATTSTASACIGASNELYVIAQSSESSFQIFRQPPSTASPNDDDEEVEELANFNTSAPAKLVRAQYLAETETMVLCFDAGELVQVALEADADNFGQAEVVGEIEEHIAAATWSPDEELLALITGALHLDSCIHPQQWLTFACGSGAQAPTSFCSSQKTLMCSQKDPSRRKTLDKPSQSMLAGDPPTPSSEAPSEKQLLGPPPKPLPQMSSTQN